MDGWILAYGLVGVLVAILDLIRSRNDPSHVSGRLLGIVIVVVSWPFWLWQMAVQSDRDKKD